MSIIVYISLGIVGLPVFSGFGSGIGYIMGASGGFIIGFLVTGGAFLALEGIFGKGKRRLVYAAICQILMYLCGAAWFAFVFGGADSFLSALALCTLPYLLPDAIKILLSSIISTRLEKVINM